MQRWQLLNLSEWIPTQLLNVRFLVIEHLLHCFVDIIGRQCVIEDFKDHAVNVVIFKSAELVSKCQQVKPLLDKFSKWMKIIMEIV